MFKRIKHKDAFGQAAIDFLNKGKSAQIKIYSSVSSRESINSSYLFRTPDKMPEPEQLALKYCKGNVYDIGAGAGCHALALQNSGFDVTAVEDSPLLCKAMQQQGIKNVLQEDLWNLENSDADTILLMMNNIGIAGTLEQLPAFIMHLASLLQPEGQILLTSSDIVYLYTHGPLDPDKYYGEITYTVKYKSCKTDSFPWLFIDAERLNSLMEHIGLQMEILWNETHTHNYLARITRK